VNSVLNARMVLIRRVKLLTVDVRTAAEEISTGNTSLSQLTEAQAASLEQTAASMEEMTSTVKANADNAAQAAKFALDAKQQAETGGQVVGAAVQAMGQINSSSRKIADIISVIDEIAFQTNLLALNAAVEAARAGEGGRGFAVVASEVRSLAGRSATAAKEIKGLIQDSVSKVNDGTKLVDASGKTLTDIVAAVKRVTDIVSMIASSSSEQSAGIEQVNTAVTQIEQATQKNAALVEQTAAASQAIVDQVQELHSVIAHYQVGPEETARGRAKHAA
jgi:methyl-accepting chemotaxis protein